MGLIARFFGLEEESKRVQYLAKVSAAFMPIAALAFMMSSTFYSVFVAETLFPPPINLSVGMAFVGILAAISMATQLVLDYPTGGVGDWIGQRWILSASLICFAIAFFLTSIAHLIPYFWFFVIIYIITAIGSALNSGAIAAWFDNNYRAAAKDPERRAYSVAQGRMGMFFQISATAVLIPGAIMAVVMGRQSVFLFQAALCIILGFSALFIFRDFPEVTENRPHRSLRNYYHLLKEGLKFSFSTRMVMFYLIGTVIIASTIIVWGNMLLFLIYYTYLAYSDIAVAMFRTVLFAFGVLWIERAGIWTRSLSPPKWIPRSRVLQTCGPLFYFAFATILFYMPPLTIILPFPLMYLQIPTILISAGFILTGIFSAFSNLLNQRLLLDLIPDKIRNGIYSLIPTLTLIFAVPQTLFFAPILILYNTATVLFGLGIISSLGVIILWMGLRRVPEKAVTVEEAGPGPIPPEVP